jgi:hypothetical protein
MPPFIMEFPRSRGVLWLDRMEDGIKGWYRAAGPGSTGWAITRCADDTSLQLLLILKLAALTSTGQEVLTHTKASRSV